MIELNITGENTYASDHLDQYDYGQILRMHGDIPSPVEVQFSLQKSGGEAQRSLGVEVDGAVEVDIPDEMLRNNETTHDYQIYAFLYVRNETSGETTHRIIIPVKSRPKPGDYIPPGQPDYGEQLLANIQNETRQAIDAKDEAKTSASWAEESRRFADQASQSAGVAAENATESARIAALAEYNAENAKNIAEEKAAQIEKKANQIKENTEKISELKGDMANKLDKPATAQVGQIFRVQAIREDGSLVIEAVDMPSGSGVDSDQDYWREKEIDFECIIEEAVGIVEISEINGKPFAFDEVRIFVLVPDRDNKTYIWVEHSENDYFHAASNVINTGLIGKVVFHIFKYLGKWTYTLKQSSGTTPSYWDKNGSPVYANNMLSEGAGIGAPSFGFGETIDKIRITGNFQPGAIIRIWGKPAKK